MPETLEFARVADCLVHHAEHAPATIAFSSEELTLDYAQLHVEVERYAAALQASGIGAGDFVGVLGPARTECYLIFLACCRLGAVFTGLNPKHTLRELEYVVTDSRPRLVFDMHRDDAEQLAKLESLHVRTDSFGEIVSLAPGRGRAVISLSDFLARGARRVEVGDHDPRAPAAVVYTSGSTGEPKGALLSQPAMLRSALLSWRYWYGAPPVVRAITHHPINHVGWLVIKGLATLVAGGTLFIRERFDPAAVPTLIEQERLTIWNVFPAELAMVMNGPTFAEADLTSLECVAFGTLPSVESLRQLREHTDAALSTSYGLTEACGGAVTATDHDADLETVAGTIGRPLPGVESRVVDGELWIRDGSVFLGYLNKPEQTALTLDADGWLHTGDVVTVDGDGVMRLVGRLKEMFKSGGYNVYPTEIETVVSSHPAVSSVAVVHAPHPIWSQVGVAFVVLKPGAELSEAELDDYCRTSLANYKIPKRFEMLTELPQLRNGKVDRLRLRELAERGCG